MKSINLFRKTIIYLVTLFVMALVAPVLNVIAEEDYHADEWDDKGVEKCDVERLYYGDVGSLNCNKCGLDVTDINRLYGKNKYGITFINRHGEGGKIFNLVSSELPSEAAHSYSGSSCPGGFGTNTGGGWRNLKTVDSQYLSDFYDEFPHVIFKEARKKSATYYESIGYASNSRADSLRYVMTGKEVKPEIEIIAPDGHVIDKSTYTINYTPWYYNISYDKYDNTSFSTYNHKSVEKATRNDLYQMINHTGVKNGTDDVYNWYFNIKATPVLPSSEYNNKGDLVDFTPIPLVTEGDYCAEIIFRKESGFAGVLWFTYDICYSDAFLKSITPEDPTESTQTSTDSSTESKPPIVPSKEKTTTSGGTTTTEVTTTQKVTTGDSVKVNGAAYKIGSTSVSVSDGSKASGAVKIPEVLKVNGRSYNVTSISDKAFKNNKNITSVTIGKNVKTVGKEAFYGCSKLTKISFGKNVTKIDAKAFYKCKALKKVTIPSKVSKIGTKAFYGCNDLKTITVKTTKLTTKNKVNPFVKTIF